MLLALEDDLYIGTEKQIGPTSMTQPHLSVMLVRAVIFIPLIPQRKNR